MSANVSPEERFIYWMVLLMAGFMLLHEVLKLWLPSYLAAGLSGLFLGLGAPLLPGAKEIPAGRRLLAGGATALAAVIISFAVDILFERL